MSLLTRYPTDVHYEPEPLNDTITDFLVEQDGEFDGVSAMEVMQHFSMAYGVVSRNYMRIAILDAFYSAFRFELSEKYENLERIVKSQEARLTDIDSRWPAMKIRFDELSNTAVGGSYEWNEAARYTTPDEKEEELDQVDFDLIASKRWGSFPRLHEHERTLNHRVFAYYFLSGFIKRNPKIEIGIEIAYKPATLTPETDPMPTYPDNDWFIMYTGEEADDEEDAMTIDYFIASNIGRQIIKRDAKLKRQKRSKEKNEKRKKRNTEKGMSSSSTTELDASSDSDDETYEEKVKRLHSQKVLEEYNRKKNAALPPASATPSYDIDAEYKAAMDLKKAREEERERKKKKKTKKPSSTKRKIESSHQSASNKSPRIVHAAGDEDTDEEDPAFRGRDKNMEPDYMGEEAENEKIIKEIDRDDEHYVDSMFQDTPLQPAPVGPYYDTIASAAAASMPVEKSKHRAILQSERESELLATLDAMEDGEEKKIEVAPIRASAMSIAMLPIITSSAPPKDKTIGSFASEWTSFKSDYKDELKQIGFDKWVIEDAKDRVKKYEKALSKYTQKHKDELDKKRRDIGFQFTHVPKLKPPRNDAEVTDWIIHEARRRFDKKDADMKNALWYRDTMKKTKEKIEKRLNLVLDRWENEEISLYPMEKRVQDGAPYIDYEKRLYKLRQCTINRKYAEYEHDLLATPNERRFQYQITYDRDRLLYIRELAEVVCAFNELDAANEALNWFNPLLYYFKLVIGIKRLFLAAKATSVYDEEADLALLSILHILNDTLSVTVPKAKTKKGEWIFVDEGEAMVFNHRRNWPFRSHMYADRNAERLLMRGNHNKKYSTIDDEWIEFTIERLHNIYKEQAATLFGVHYIRMIQWALIRSQMWIGSHGYEASVYALNDNMIGPVGDTFDLQADILFTVGNRDYHLYWSDVEAFAAPPKKINLYTEWVSARQDLDRETGRSNVSCSNMIGRLAILEQVCINQNNQLKSKQLDELRDMHYLLGQYRADVRKLVFDHGDKIKQLEKDELRMRKYNEERKDKINTKVAYTSAEDDLGDHKFMKNRKDLVKKLTTKERQDEVRVAAGDLSKLVATLAHDKHFKPMWANPLDHPLDDEKRPHTEKMMREFARCVMYARNLMISIEHAYNVTAKPKASEILGIERNSTILQESIIAAMSPPSRKLTIEIQLSHTSALRGKVIPPDELEFNYPAGSSDETAIRIKEENEEKGEHKTIVYQDSDSDVEGADNDIIEAEAETEDESEVDSDEEERRKKKKKKTKEEIEDEEEEEEEVKAYEEEVDNEQVNANEKRLRGKGKKKDDHDLEDEDQPQKGDESEIDEEVEAIQIWESLDIVQDAPTDEREAADEELQDPVFVEMKKKQKGVVTGVDELMADMQYRFKKRLLPAVTRILLIPMLSAHQVFMLDDDENSKFQYIFPNRYKEFVATAVKASKQTREIEAEEIRVKIEGIKSAVASSSAAAAASYPTTQIDYNKTYKGRELGSCVFPLSGGLVLPPYDDPQWEKQATRIDNQIAKMRVKLSDDDEDTDTMLEIEAKELKRIVRIREQKKQGKTGGRTTETGDSLSDLISQLSIAH